MLGIVTTEVMLWYFDYRNFNATGVRSVTVVVIAIIASVVRMTASRLLVVAVSVGFGVVKSVDAHIAVAVRVSALMSHVRCVLS